MLLYTYLFSGQYQKRILDAARRYKAFQQQHKQEGKCTPEGDGVLIFDEVRVVARLMWNSRNQRVVGFSMHHNDLANLLDVYSLLDPDAAPKSTTYILQFLWRDLTSSFDVVGPYFTSSGPMESKAILGIVLETIKLFYLYDFNTSVLVCDGASPNLTTIKTTMGLSGVFARQPLSVDPNAINPSFTNPFNPSLSIYWMICPSHQVRI